MNKEEKEEIKRVELVVSSLHRELYFLGKTIIPSFKLIF